MHDNDEVEELAFYKTLCKKQNFLLKMNQGIIAILLIINIWHVI